MSSDIDYRIALMNEVKSFVECKYWWDSGEVTAVEWLYDLTSLLTYTLRDVRKNCWRKLIIRLSVIIIAMVEVETQQNILKLSNILYLYYFNKERVFERFSGSHDSGLRQ